MQAPTTSVKRFTNTLANKMIIAVAKAVYNHVNKNAKINCQHNITFGL